MRGQSETISRCEHGTYRPEFVRTGQPNPACSVCSNSSPVVSLNDLLAPLPKGIKIETVSDGFRVETKSCEIEEENEDVEEIEIEDDGEDAEPLENDE